MPKGDRKRQAAGTLFTKNHTGKQNAVVDDTQPGTSSEVQCEPAGTMQHDSSDTIPRLQTRAQLKNQTTSEHLGNRIVSLDQLISTMNEVFQDHLEFPVHCENINLQLLSEKKMGLGSNLQFTCQTCGFVSQSCRTYVPCAGKSKGAAINMLLASALQDTSIGVEKANILLSSMDIPPPSRSHLQKLVTQASEETVRLNERDMAEKRRLVVQHNEASGATDPRQLDLSFDCRYNATRMVSSYKPGQSASQAYGVAIENNTSYKYIVGLAIENKLCWTGAFLRNRGYDVQCPGGHTGCTANLSYMEPHSERRIAFDIADQMYKDDIVVRTLTTDGDTKSFLGMQDFYDQLGEAWNVSRQADPHHLGSSQIRRVRKAKWSDGMFPNCANRQARQQAISALAKDIKSRSSKVIEKLRALGDGDVTKQIKKLPEVCAATVECYSGNCSFCPHGSLVCNGVGGRGDWWYDSEFLPTHGIDRLEMNENDKELLRTILEVRLSEQAVYSVSSNTSTQKCEAFNRGALSSLPKEVNFSKTFAGRLASKTLQLNNSIQEAVETKVSSITGHKLSPKPGQYLEYCTRHAEMKREQKKTPAFKGKRRQTRARLEYEYHSARSASTSEQPDYSKGQLD